MRHRGFWNEVKLDLRKQHGQRLRAFQLFQVGGIRFRVQMEEKGKIKEEILLVKNSQSAVMNLKGSDSLCCLEGLLYIGFSFLQLTPYN